MRSSRALLAVTLVAVAVVAIACGSAAPIESSCPEAAPATLTATGTACPTGGSPLRFTGGTPTNFGQTFMSTYCTR